jgi:hypothetical protein
MAFELKAFTICAVVGITAVSLFFLVKDWLRERKAMKLQGQERAAYLI